MLYLSSPFNSSRDADCRDVNILFENNASHEYIGLLLTVAKTKYCGMLQMNETLF